VRSELLVGDQQPIVDEAPHHLQKAWIARASA
jgi:hypothetical protein